MQILTHNQVSYCNVIREESGELYLPGISFQNKLFIKSKFFTEEQRQKAIDYCKQEFLQSKGSKSYVLVEDATGFTVWMEDKSAKVVGKQNAMDIVETINLEELVAKMRSVGGIKIKDRRHNFKVYPQCFIGKEAYQYLIETLKISSEQAMKLGQRLINEKWIHHVVDEHPFQNDHLFYRFYWDEI